MLIFLDTEFTNFSRPELISIALAADGAPDFYAELNDFLPERCSLFVIKEVIPLLGSVPGATCSKSELTDRLRAWFDDLPEAATILYDFSADWELLYAALLGELPVKVQTHEIIDKKIFRHSAYKLGEVLTYTKTWPPHHALADARALKEGYLRWKAALDGRKWNFQI